MGSRFKDRGLGAIKADERGSTEAGAAGGVGCFDVGSFCDGVGCQSLPRGDEQRRGKRVSAGLLHHGKRVLERLNDVQKGQGYLVFVALKRSRCKPSGRRLWSQ